DADRDEGADGAPAPTAKARVWPCRPRRGSAADERSQTGEDQLRLVHQDEPLSHGQRRTAAELLGVGGGAKVREAGRRERKHEQDVQERPLQVRVVAGKGSSSGGGEAHRREPEAPASREDSRHQRHPAAAAGSRSRSSSGASWRPPRPFSPAVSASTARPPDSSSSSASSTSSP